MVIFRGRIRVEMFNPGQEIDVDPPKLAIRAGKKALKQENICNCLLLAKPY